MSQSHAVAQDYPVVLFAHRATGAGWYFRGADQDIFHGPFLRRDEAVQFALESIAAQVAGTPTSPPSRRAA